MSFPGARQLGIRGPATGIKKLGLMTGPENGPTATPTPTPSAFDPATLFGVSDKGGYWTAASLSDLKQLHDGTTAVTVANGTQVAGYIAERSGKGSPLRTNHDFGRSADGTARPTLNSVGSINYLSFDGVDDYLADSFLNDDTSGTRYSLSATSGWTRASVIRLLSGSDLNGNCLFGTASNYTDTGLLLCSSTTGHNGRVLMDQGANLEAVTPITGSGSTFFVVIEEYHGASSSIQIDAGTPVTGDAGSNAGSVPTGGNLLVGSSMFGNYQKFDFVEGLVINRLLATTEKNNLRTKFGADGGKTI